jgi:hypothetical protein
MRGECGRTGREGILNQQTTATEIDEPHERRMGREAHTRDDFRRKDDGVPPCVVSLLGSQRLPSDRNRSGGLPTAASPSIPVDWLKSSEREKVKPSVGRMHTQFISASFVYISNGPDRGPVLTSIAPWRFHGVVGGGWYRLCSSLVFFARAAPNR